jgi:hypothetical protein
MKAIRPVFLIAAVVILSLALPAVTRAGDKSFSTLVKNIESNYRAKRKGIPLLGLARFAVRVIRPAGVKNFKVVMLENLDFSSHPAGQDFHTLLRAVVDPVWQPLAQYNSRVKNHWSHVYVQPEDSNIKLLVVTLQRKEAYVVQVKFSPEKLAKFLEDPRILGIPLGDRRDSSAPSQQPGDTPTTN